MPKQTELVLGMRVTTKDSYLLLNGGPDLPTKKTSSRSGEFDLDNFGLLPHHGHSSQLWLSFLLYLVVCCVILCCFCIVD